VRKIIRTIGHSVAVLVGITAIGVHIFNQRKIDSFFNEKPHILSYNLEINNIKNCLQKENIRNQIKEKELEQIVNGCVYSKEGPFPRVMSEFNKWKYAKQLMHYYSSIYLVVPEEPKLLKGLPDLYGLDAA